MLVRGERFIFVNQRIQERYGYLGSANIWHSDHVSFFRIDALYTRGDVFENKLSYDVDTITASDAFRYPIMSYYYQFSCY